MTEFLRFRNEMLKYGNGQKLFLMLRIRHWLQYEYVKKHPYDNALIAHLNISHCLWDEFWWRALRTYSKSPLFHSLVKRHFY